MFCFIYFGRVSVSRNFFLSASVCDVSAFHTSFHTHEVLCYVNFKALDYFKMTDPGGWLSQFFFIICGLIIKMIHVSENFHLLVLSRVKDYSKRSDLDIYRTDNIKRYLFQ